MALKPARELGDVLRERGVLTDDQLQLVRTYQSKQDHPAHRIILDLGLATEQETLEALAAVHALEFDPLTHLVVPKKLLKQVPLKLILHYRFIPIELSDESLTVAYGDLPSSLELANLRLLLKRKIRYVLTTPSQIEAIIKAEFGLGAETVHKLRDSKQELHDQQELVFDLSDETTGKSMDGTISELVDQILEEALRLRTTDIHFEPYARTIKLRYRIDGLLQTIPVPRELKPLYTAIVSRLKVMAELDISDRRFPQDGRISMKSNGENYDLRISVLPTKHGEALCLRILGRQSLFLAAEELGMLPEQESLFHRLTRLAQGMVLISGPTGSGKTTTLYAALTRAHDERRKVITIEDPIEYQIEGIAQMQTREDIGLSFAKGLRSILRHDPDVVLVGEIRDRETAEIAVRAAQTGHLVLSTLHSNDSLATIPRLLNMGVDATVLAASLNCSIAQRLARKNCKACRVQDDHATPELRDEMKACLKQESEGLHPQLGAGCLECQESGVRGRIAIYEFAAITEPIAEAISNRQSLIQLRATASEQGWKPLRQIAFQRVADGTISLSELQRITWRLDFTQI